MSQVADGACLLVCCLALSCTVCCLAPLLPPQNTQDEVSSKDQFVKLGDVFRHGQVVVARILATNIEGGQGSGQEGPTRR